MKTANEMKNNDSDINSDEFESFESESDNADDDDLPSAHALNAQNFEETFLKYTQNWKMYMADIPNALIQCLTIFSETELTKYWNILIAVELEHTEISSFCDFLSHSIHQTIANYSKRPSGLQAKRNTIEREQFENNQMRLWLFRDGCVISYNMLCSAYLKHCVKEKITLTLSEWTSFWISHYTMEQNENTVGFETIASFLFDVIPLSADKENQNGNKDKLSCKACKIPSMAMRSMKLSDSVSSLYLELFLFWFVTQKSHKWTYDGPSIEEEEHKDNDENSDGVPKKSDSSRWKRMTKQMKLKIFHIFEEEDASLFPGYHWKYLLDYDSLSIWLQSGRVGGYGEIKVDWSNDRFDQFLSNPLNQTEQRYLPTLKC